MDAKMSKWSIPQIRTRGTLLAHYRLPAQDTVMELEEAIQKAQAILHYAEHKPQKPKTPGSSKWKSLQHRLHELYTEECSKTSGNKHLRTGVHLLDKLAKREKLMCLIVSLSSEGYSLMLRGENGAETETIRLPYEESELLEYLDAEELPPVLVDLLEKSQVNIFYSGCVITEVRDYRQSGNGQNYTTRYILLRPTVQTLLCDINAIANEGQRFTSDEKLHLESQLLLATQEPLCLEPSLAVTCIENKVHQDRHRLNGRPLKRCMKRHSHIMRARQAILKTLPAPKELGLIDFLSRRKDRTPTVHVNLKLGKTCVDMWRQRDVDHSRPDVNVVKQHATSQERSKPKDNSLILTVEEILETDRGNGKVHYARVSIYKHQLDESYVGELYYDRDYNIHEGKRPGVTCRFPLGSCKNANMYLNQFRDLFTEEGRRQVKITRIVAGQNVYSNNTTAPTVQSAAGTGAQSAAASNSSSICSASMQAPLQQNNSNNQTVQTVGVIVKTEPGQSDSAPLSLPVALINAGGINNISVTVAQPSLSASPTVTTQLHLSQPAMPILSPPLASGRHTGRQPPAYLNLSSRASSAPPEATMMMASPQGTPTSLPASSPLSVSMAPPPTPPLSSTPSAPITPASPSPNIIPNPGRVITPTLEGVAGRVATPTGGVNTQSGVLPHSGTVTISMAGGGSIAMGLVGPSQPGLVQTAGGVLSSPINVMTTLSGFTSDMINLTTNSTSISSATSAATPTTTSPSQANIISTPAGLLTGPINIINTGQGGLLSPGPVNLTTGAQLASGISQARLSQLNVGVKGTGGLRAQGPLSLLQQGQQAFLYSAIQQQLQQQLHHQLQQQQQQQSTSAAQCHRQGGNIQQQTGVKNTLGASQAATVLSQLTAIQGLQAGLPHLTNTAHQQALQQQQQQQLQVQLAYQKQQQQQLLLRQQQQQQHSGSSSKGKGKKRTTPTPPK